jgi:hypothetical protein
MKCIVRFFATLWNRYFYFDSLDQRSEELKQAVEAPKFLLSRTATEFRNLIPSCRREAKEKFLCEKNLYEQRILETRRMVKEAESGVASATAPETRELAWRKLDAAKSAEDIAKSAGFASEEKNLSSFLNGVAESLRSHERNRVATEGRVIFSSGYVPRLNDKTSIEACSRPECLDYLQRILVELDGEYIIANLDHEAVFDKRFVREGKGAGAYDGLQTYMVYKYFPTGEYATTVGFATNSMSQMSNIELKAIIADRAAHTASARSSTKKIRWSSSSSISNNSQ